MIGYKFSFISRVCIYRSFSCFMLLLEDARDFIPEAFRQEAAKITYMNPKYVKDGSILTYRRNRRAPYLTNANITHLHSWGNNVTGILEFYDQKLGVKLINLEFKTCDILMTHWLKDWIKTYTDIPLLCPVPANTYHFKDIELPPKDFPIPLPPSDYYVTLRGVTTKEKEKIVELSMMLKV